MTGLFEKITSLLDNQTFFVFACKHQASDEKFQEFYKMMNGHYCFKHMTERMEIIQKTEFHLQNDFSFEIPAKGICEHENCSKLAFWNLFLKGNRQQ